MAPLRFLADLGGPLLVLGHLFLYAGTGTFLGADAPRRGAAAILAAFLAAYLGLFLVKDAGAGRAVVVSVGVGLVSLMTARRLLAGRDPRVARSATSTGAVFLVFGGFLAFRAVVTALAPLRFHQDLGAVHQIAHLVPMAASSLWTFGFLIMVNQRLDADNQAERARLLSAEKALRASEETYRSVLEASPDDITITDLEGRVIMASPAAREMFGFGAEYHGFKGLSVLDFIVQDDQARARENVARMFRGEPGEPQSYRALRADRTTFDIEVISRFIRDQEGRRSQILFVIRDVTARREAEQRIHGLIQQLEAERNTAQLHAVTDSLTGLGNRRFFDEALSREFYRAKRTGKPLSLIMLDIDHFKRFNDTYGHVAGDDCLRRIAEALRPVATRSPDTVARFGGEEFVVVLPDADGAGARVLAERIRTAVDRLGIPHAASDAADHVTVSLGVVTVVAGSLPAPEAMVRLADEALYAAKRGGRNRIEVSTFRT